MGFGNSPLKQLIPSPTPPLTKGVLYHRATAAPGERVGPPRQCGGVNRNRRAVQGACARICGVGAGFPAAFAGPAPVGWHLRAASRPLHPGIPDRAAVQSGRSATHRLDTSHDRPTFRPCRTARGQSRRRADCGAVARSAPKGGVEGQHGTAQGAGARAGPGGGRSFGRYGGPGGG